MSIHRLPDTLSLYHDGPQVFRVQHGQLVAQTPLAYPRVYASHGRQLLELPFWYWMNRS